MNKNFAKFVVVTFMLPGLVACDEAAFVEHDDELLALGLYNLAPSRIRETERLEQHQLEPAPLEPFNPAGEDGPSCGPAEVSTPAQLCPAWRRSGRVLSGLWTAVAAGQRAECQRQQQGSKPRAGARSGATPQS